MFIKILFRGTQAFFILQSGVQFFLPYHWRWYYVILDNLSSCFMIHMLLRMRYFKSINLFVGVILCHISPKAFHWECCYLWCLSMIQAFSISFSVKEVFHLFVDLKQEIVSVSGRLSPHNFEMFSVSPQQACAFRCWFSNNSVKSYFARVLSKLICGRSWHFSSPFFFSQESSFYSFVPEALWCCSLHSSSWIVRIVFFSCLSI